jgi:RNA polymerase sigma factor (sigma-70 family)
MTEQLREQCCYVGRQVLARRGWELVQDETAFTREVLTQVQLRLGRMHPRQRNRRPLEKVIEDATVNCYGHLWHAACGADGTPRQWRAFKELHHYLYPIALYRANYDVYVAEESTQEALIGLWQSLDQVRDPGSFARWAGVIVSNKVRRELEKRTQKGREISITDLRRPEHSERQPAREDGGLGPELQGIGDHPNQLMASQKPRMTDEIRARVETAIKGCLRRSKQQQAVIIGFFLNEKDLKELADELDKRLNNIYVLKTRALARLRECQEFLTALEEFV